MLRQEKNENFLSKLDKHEKKVNPKKEDYFFRLMGSLLKNSFKVMASLL